jgi:nucleotidyltransferase substrate binding protein (TIGR01987 family)
MPLDLSSLEKAITAMEQLIAKAEDREFMGRIDRVAQDGMRAGVIQHFEIVFELSWKFIQRWIRQNRSIEEAGHPRTRRDLFRMAAELGLVTDPEAWFAYGDARNRTVHTYNEREAVVVYELSKSLVRDARNLLKKLQAAND